VPTAQPQTVAERQLPPEVRRLLAPLIPVERNLSDAGREAAALFVVLLATAAALVLGRDQVVRIRAATAGGAAEQLRIVGLGGAVVVALGCGLFLAVFVLLRTVIGLAAPSAGLVLQTIVTAVSVCLLVVAVAALLGFTAAAWRAGTWFLAFRPFRGIGERVPTGLVTLAAAALIFLLAQVPMLGRLVAVAVLAYSLGAFVRARFLRTEARPA
jgi:hypothetical protein